MLTEAEELLERERLTRRALETDLQRVTEQNDVDVRAWQEAVRQLEWQLEQRDIQLRAAHR